MKKICNILAIFMMALCMVFASCNSCTKPTPEPVFAGYNFDEVTIADYDYIASQEQDFVFRTVEARFDSVLTQECDNKINYINTWFQCGPMVNMIFHTPDTNRVNSIMEFYESISTEKSYKIDTTDVDFKIHLIFHDNIIECGEINARNPITFDSCMTIVAPIKDQLYTRVLTIRRFLDPRMPENPMYIFGQGNVMVDVITGELMADETNEEIPTVKFESGLEMNIE